MIKKSLLIAILLLPLAFAKASTGMEILPVPECWPCGSETVTLAGSNRILPVPECWPCGSETLRIDINMKNTMGSAGRLRRDAKPPIPLNLPAN